MTIRTKKGFTLAEVMIAVVVFIIGLGALFAVYTQSVGSGKRTEYAYTAYNLAKNRIDALKTSAFSSLPTASELSTAINADGAVDPAGEFIRTTVVSSQYLGDPNLTEITVSVDFFLNGIQSASPMQMTTVAFNET